MKYIVHTYVNTHSGGLWGNLLLTLYLFVLLFWIHFETILRPLEAYIRRERESKVIEVAAGTAREDGGEGEEARMI